MSVSHIIALVLAACVLPATNAAAEAVRIASVQPDGSLQLADGRQVELADIVQPEPDALKAFINRELEIDVLAADRYGTPLVRLSDGTGSMQHQLIKSQQAMAYGAPLHDCSLLDYPVPSNWRVNHSDAGKHMGKWRQVSGMVHEVAVKKQMAYINFGADWKNDFTIYIPRTTLKQLDTEWLRTLKGKSVRVRGFLHDYYGPRITLLEPAMMEVDHETRTDCD